MFLNGMIVGLFIGAIIGFICCSMLVVAKRSDEIMEQNLYKRGQGRE